MYSRASQVNLTSSHSTQIGVIWRTTQILSKGTDKKSQKNVDETYNLNFRTLSTVLMITFSSFGVAKFLLFANYNLSPIANFLFRSRVSVITTMGYASPRGDPFGVRRVN